MKCPECFKTLKSLPGREEHQRVTGHCICQSCSLLFLSFEQYQNHMLELHSNQCPFCRKGFGTEGGCRAHQRALNHAYCTLCSLPFSTMKAFKLHNRNFDHTTEYHCCDCNQDFPDPLALDAHFSSCKLLNGNKGLVNRGYQCNECDKAFSTEAGLTAHKNSLVHRGLPEVTCTHPECNKTFPSNSALAHHLESGNCASGWNWKNVVAAVSDADPQRLITSEAILGTTFIPGIQGSVTSASCFTPKCDTPASTVGGVSLSSAGFYTPSTGLATPTSSDLLSVSSQLEQWATASITCPLCPTRVFVSYAAVEAHMNSAVHSPRFIRCPSLLPNIAAHMDKRFNLPSALLQHLEAEVCLPGKQGKKAQKSLKMLEKKLTSILQVAAEGWLVRSRVGGRPGLE
ncbi:hypothetical protein DFH27DRAFT_326766 [Peziza echinospora]|nr:hypothetical protein DFH27DRAFT_326766 [Peziza echinospora]